jgi:hypothetical protein
VALRTEFRNVVSDSSARVAVSKRSLAVAGFVRARLITDSTVGAATKVPECGSSVVIKRRAADPCHSRYAGIPREIRPWHLAPPLLVVASALLAVRRRCVGNPGIAERRWHEKRTSGILIGFLAIVGLVGSGERADAALIAAICNDLACSGGDDLMVQDNAASDMLSALGGLSFLHLRIRVHARREHLPEQTDARFRDGAATGSHVLRHHS